MSNAAYDPLTQRFIATVKSGDAAALRSLLTREPSLHGKVSSPLFSFDSPALVAAASRNDRAMIDALLDAGADPGVKSGWWAGGFGALHSTSDPALAEHLVSRGAVVDAHAAAKHGWIDRLKALVEREPSLVHERGGDGQTPLHLAKTVEIADYLLSKGSEIDARDLDHGGTPAQWAVGGRHEVVRFLMSRGATADAFMAASVGEMDWLKNALLGDPVLLKARVDDKTFLNPPNGGGHIYQYVIGCDATLLHAATQHDQPAVVELLVSIGLDANVRGGYDDGTPLHVAAWHNRVATATKLLELGADPELDSGKLHRNTPLGWAIVAGSVEVVDLLVSRGVGMRDHYAADAKKGIQGAFREYAQPRAGAYEAILERLMRTSGM
jgi:ankyrin repeat protein